MQHDLKTVIATHVKEYKHSNEPQNITKSHKLAKLLNTPKPQSVAEPHNTPEPQQIAPLKMPENSNHLLDMGIFAAITILMLIGLLFFLLR